MFKMQWLDDTLMRLSNSKNDYYRDLKQKHYGIVWMIVETIYREREILFMRWGWWRVWSSDECNFSQTFFAGSESETRVI